jgi:hypothetical protein
MRCVDQHEMSGGPAHLGARHHQAEMRGLDVLAAHFETIVHRRAQAGSITAQAGLNTAVHLFGYRHGSISFWNALSKNGAKWLVFPADRAGEPCTFIIPSGS